MDNNEQSMLITPEEALRRRMESLQSAASENAPTVKPEQEEMDLDKFINHGDTVKINYESMGRFSIPKTLYFKGYSVNDISDLAVSKEEDILETMVAILNNLCTDKTVKVENMLMEEFYETLIALKATFNSRIHKHRWMHKCQDKEPQEDRKFSSSDVDLATLNYDSILKAEEKLKEYYGKKFSLMKPEEWSNYVLSKYKGASTPTKDEEADGVKIKEPITLVVNGDELEFQFPRIGDVVRGLKLAFRDFNGKVSRLKAKQQPHGMTLEEWKEYKDEELEKYEKEKQKTAILASRAMSLVKKNGEDLEYLDRLAIFKSLPVNVMESLTNFFDSVRFGVQDERELPCDLCGSMEKRSLHRELSPIELLPIESSDPVKTGRDTGIVTTTIIYM
jgi:hypothetical protein